MTKVGDKKAARKFCGALRRAADPKAYEGLMYQLAEKLRRLPGKVLGVYQPIASEPDPMPAVRSWLSEGMNRTLALPWCLDSSASVMVYRIWHPQVGQCHILQGNLALIKIHSVNPKFPAIHIDDGADGQIVLFVQMFSLVMSPIFVQSSKVNIVARRPQFF